MDTKKNIKTLDKRELSAYFKQLNEPAYRAEQVWDWLWNKQAESFDEMTNLPKSLREKLEEHFDIPKARLHLTRQSSDGTIKNAVELPDNLIVESVIIPEKKRATACISSQVGCSLNCLFCATGRLKRMRNLTASEIVDQVVQAREQSLTYYGYPLTNIVFMGMGEPLLNYENVKEAIEIITSEKGLGMSPKRITLSTAGIPERIKQLALDLPKINLAVSLHSAIDEVRTRIMPSNKAYGGLDALLESLQFWYKKTKSKITFEYLVFKDINDDDRSIRALVKFASKIPSKVNLIQYNPTDSFDRFAQADDEVLEAYRQALKEKGIIATVRRSRGQDIEAACGQLAAKYEDVKIKIEHKPISLSQIKNRQ